ncbi:hypothetical protein CLF_103670 [Clonorchis sinensis]|uniref:Uncharacterized protein n=1 Tax=Clonorchis sinensis TaxID=79923 RepID=G7YA59_CLOSI|nr:hypothetical protein CLF_103670 [Clonorchis sinensis]
MIRRHLNLQWLRLGPEVKADIHPLDIGGDYLKDNDIGICLKKFQFSPVSGRCEDNLFFVQIIELHYTRYQFTHLFLERDFYARTSPLEGNLITSDSVNILTHFIDPQGSVLEPSLCTIYVSGLAGSPTCRRSESPVLWQQSEHSSHPTNQTFKMQQPRETKASTTGRRTIVLIDPARDERACGVKAVMVSKAETEVETKRNLRFSLTRLNVPLLFMQGSSSFDRKDDMSRVGYKRINDSKKNKENKQITSNMNISFVEDGINIKVICPRDSTSFLVSMLLGGSGQLGRLESAVLRLMPEEERGDELQDLKHASVKNLSCPNYRILMWEMPVSFGDKISRLIEQNDLRLIAMRSHHWSPPVREEEYFRSLHAVHFYHRPEILWDYDVHGSRKRDQRSYRLIGGKYYCVNHPPHYKEAAKKLKLEMELEANLKEQMRQLPGPCYIRPSKRSSVDPVLELPPASVALRSRPPKSYARRASRYVNLKSTDLDFLDAVRQQWMSVRDLYQEARNVLAVHLIRGNADFYLHRVCVGPGPEIIHTQSARLRWYDIRHTAAYFDERNYDNPRPVLGTHQDFIEHWFVERISEESTYMYWVYRLIDYILINSIKMFFLFCTQEDE